jgi:hypothetical protein
MPTQLVPGEDDHSAVMALIGHICVQWARLENTLLGLCAVCTRLSPEEAFLTFGGLDMRPRLNMAINLATHHKMQPHLLKRLRGIRETISKKKLDDKRNQAVHGVHSDSDLPQHIRLTMVRWGGDKRVQDVSIIDLHSTGREICDLANECYSILMAHVERLDTDHFREYGSSEFVETNPSIWGKIKQYARSCINHIFG